jgi:hypothetical protein
MPKLRIKTRVDAAQIGLGFVDVSSYVIVQSYDGRVVAEQYSPVELELPYGGYYVKASYSYLYTSEYVWLDRDVELELVYRGAPWLIADVLGVAYTPTPPPVAPTPTPITPIVEVTAPPVTITPVEVVAPPVAPTPVAYTPTEVTGISGLDVVADKTTVLANEIVTFTVTYVEPVQDIEVRAYVGDKLVWIGSIPVKTLNIRKLSIFPGRILESWNIEADSVITFTFTAKETREQVTLQITVIKAPVEIKPPEIKPIPTPPPTPPPPEILKEKVEVAPPKVDLVKLGLIGYLIYEILRRR